MISLEEGKANEDRKYIHPAMGKSGIGEIRPVYPVVARKRFICDIREDNSSIR